LVQSLTRYPAPPDCICLYGLVACFRNSARSSARILARSATRRFSRAEASNWPSLYDIQVTCLAFPYPQN
jgi:hypothetical protein